MTDETPADHGDAIDADDIATFASRLQAHADGLDDHERRLLDLLLFRAMTPLQRRALTPTPDRFDADERDVLDRLTGGD